ncbi:hypothetical protein EYF80_047671 [Liparis tanakae]|uniref:Uncharacterized protein n=1 Tax=Liparis tanakae TaxID=230148 RepID=A0A4Z2FMY5_9TELE|nr:hypothetical protein EYF80_047671 [Liparis tanakae]
MFNRNQRGEKRNLTHVNDKIIHQAPALPQRRPLGTLNGTQSTQQRAKETFHRVFMKEHMR